MFVKIKAAIYQLVSHLIDATGSFAIRVLKTQTCFMPGHITSGDKPAFQIPIPYSRVAISNQQNPPALPSSTGFVNLSNLKRGIRSHNKWLKSLPMVAGTSLPLGPLARRYDPSAMR